MTPTGPNPEEIKQKNIRAGYIDGDRDRWQNPVTSGGRTTDTPSVQIGFDQGKEGEDYPTLPEGVREALASFASKEPHLYACIGYSESQACCLERPEVQNFISSLLAAAKAEGIEIGRREGKDPLSLDKLKGFYQGAVNGERMVWSQGYREGVKAMREAVKERWFAMDLASLSGPAQFSQWLRSDDQLLNPEREENA